MKELFSNTSSEWCNDLLDCVSFNPNWKWIGIVFGVRGQNHDFVGLIEAMQIGTRHQSASSLQNDDDYHHWSLFIKNTIIFIYHKIKKEVIWILFWQSNIGIDTL